MPRTILIPLAGSASAECVLDHARTLGHALPAELLLLHSVGIPFEVGDVIAGRNGGPLARKAAAEAKQLLTESIFGDGVSGCSVIRRGNGQKGFGAVEPLDRLWRVPEAGVVQRRDETVGRSAQFPMLEQARPK